MFAYDHMDDGTQLRIIQHFHKVSSYKMGVGFLTIIGPLLRSASFFLRSRSVSLKRDEKVPAFTLSRPKKDMNSSWVVVLCAGKDKRGPFVSVFMFNSFLEG